MKKNEQNFIYNEPEYNLILDADSYKNDHSRMLKDNVEYIQSSVIPRACKLSHHTTTVVPFGYIYAINKYLTKQITIEQINEAEMMINASGYNFDRSRWQYILDEHDGFLPIVIHAIPEGTIVPIGVPIVRIENTDKKCAWLVSYIETMLLRSSWYGTTVATNAYEIKKLLDEYSLRHTNGIFNTAFSLHNFGARGATSYEAEILSSMAHAISFSGSDSLQANRYINAMYPQFDDNGKKVFTPFVFSVIASEHSVSCSQSDYETRNDYNIAVKMINLLEEEINKKIQNNSLYVLDENGNKTDIINQTIVSIVIDTYNAYRFADEFIGKKLKNKIIELSKLGGKVVLRPDSGNPTEMPIEIIKILMDNFGFSVNANGYKRLPDFLAVLQGDGIKYDSIKEILKNMDNEKLSINNIVFGMGGQLVTPEKGRDAYSFAMKATAQKVSGNDEWQHLIKDPITDFGKKSLTGHVSTYSINYSAPKALEIEEIEKRNDNSIKDMMLKVFENGEVIFENKQSFNEIRNNLIKN